MCKTLPKVHGGRQNAIMEGCNTKEIIKGNHELMHSSGRVKIPFLVNKGDKRDLILALKCFPREMTFFLEFMEKKDK